MGINGNLLNNQQIPFLYKFRVEKLVNHAQITERTENANYQCGDALKKAQKGKGKSLWTRTQTFRVRKLLTML